MALGGFSYSQIVTWLKVVLPLVALGILSTLFFLARTVDLETSIAYDDEELAELAREQRLTDPQYYGVLPNGASVSFNAEIVRPDPSDPENMLADSVSGRIDGKDGTWVTVMASNGVLDTQSGTAFLEQDVTLVSSTGFVAQSDEMTADLGEGEVYSETYTVVTSPFGELTANSMHYSSASEGGEGNVLVFSGGVNLIYLPAN